MGGESPVIIKLLQLSSPSPICQGFLNLEQQSKGLVDLLLLYHTSIRARLRVSPSPPPPPQGFLNLEQLGKGLMDLLLLYQTAQQLGVPTPNSAEFKYVWEVWGGNV